MANFDTVVKVYTDHIRPPLLSLKNQLSDTAADLISRIQKFVDKHFTGIFFGVSAVGTLYFAPKLFLVGVVAGLVGSRLWESANKKDNADKPQNSEVRLVTHLKAASECVSLIGSALTYSYSAKYMLAFPLLGGVVAGNFLYNTFRKFVPANSDVAKAI